MPWLIAIALLTWVFWGIPLGKFMGALSQGQFSWFIPAMALCMISIFFADCLAISKTFSWFTTDFPYREVLPIRGASYLLSVINYNLGQGALVLFAKRAKGVTIGRATGTVLMLMGINLVVLLILSAVGLFIADAPRALAFRPWVLGLMGAFVVYLVAITWKPAFLARVSLAEPMLNAGLRGHLAAVAVRVPHLSLVLFAHYIAMRAFGIEPPLHVFASTMPFVMLMSTIPISPQGLGTTQVAAVYFFAPYAQGDAATREATILAYSLTTSVMAILFMLTMGFLYFRTGMRLLHLAQEKDDGAGS
ncbi:MAG: lysylphosphatidylglycerol synthase domain-containing protein [bacterium]